MRNQKKQVVWIHRMVLIIFLITAIIFCGMFAWSRFIVKREGPTIDFSNKRLKVKTSATEQELLKGVTATDANGNDVTDTLMVEGYSKLLKGNCRNVTYIAYDSHNNIGKAKRTIQYTDYHSPRFGLLESPKQYGVEQGKDILDIVTVEDAIDGEIGKSVQVVSKETIKSNDFGSTIKYHLSVTNRCGDTEEITIPFSYTVTEDANNRPVVLMNEYMVYIKKGEKFHPQKYMKAVAVGKTLYRISGKKAPKSTKKFTYVPGNVIDKKEVKISYDFSTSKVGIYPVRYTVKVNGIRSTTILMVAVEK